MSILAGHEALAEALHQVVERWREAEGLRDALLACGEAGLLRPPRSDRDQSSEALLTPSFEQTARAIEQLGRASPRHGLLLGLVAHLCGCVIPLAHAGNEALRATVLPGLIAGRTIGAIAASEPDAGSDVFSLSTRARVEGEQLVLDGVKTWVTNATIADWFVVLARNETDALDAVLVSRDDPGLSIARELAPSGLCDAPMAELCLSACRVPSVRRLGRAGTGAMVFHRAMAAERAMISAGFVGALARVLDDCVTRARTRQQFGRAIGKFQSVSNRIADMRIRLEAARGLVAGAVATLQRGSRSPIEPSIAKVFVADAALAAHIDAVHIFGAVGYTQELRYVDGLRDALGLALLSGPNDVHRQLIARAMGVGA